MGAALSPPCAPTQFITPPSPAIVRAPCDLWALLPASISVYYLPTIWIPLSLSLLASNALRCSGIAYFHPRRSQLYFPLKLVLCAPVCFLRIQMAPPSSCLFLAPAPVPAAPCFQRRLALNSPSNPPLRFATARRLRCLYSAPLFPPPSAAGPAPPRFQRHPTFLVIPSRTPPRACWPLDAPVASVQRLRHPCRFCLAPTPVPAPPRFQHRPTLVGIPSRNSSLRFAAARSSCLCLPAARHPPSPPIAAAHRPPCSGSCSCSRAPALLAVVEFLTAPPFALDLLDPARGLRTRPARCRHAPFPPRPLPTCSPLLRALTTLPAPTTRDVWSFFIAPRRLDWISSPLLSTTRALAPPPYRLSPALAS
ncbi:hypothetical protein DFH08DRAFT_1085399 [Mycena albidolilacea]|uniref:Uncharacterized protein n=1 Tax=Mycena albidolilacea TaxID=1033008 RepID=A0AAD6ZIE9_9AGAR|nr:hypothetical protein DFH08DRAFT_1085399 [Mycena albidolilacea]